jgi:hypothetical protein
MPFMRHIDPSSPWCDYQRRARWFWMAFFGYVPGMALIGLLNEALVSVGASISGFPFYICGLAWMVIVVVLSFRRRAFRCPRCGKHFFASWWFYNDFARKCVHCGLPKWEGS